MTTDGFELELERRLRAYAAIAAAEPTADEIETALAARPAGRAQRLGIVARDVRWLLVAAIVLLVVAALAAIAVGRLRDRRPPFDPGGSLAIVAGAIDGGVDTFDRSTGTWINRSSGSLWRVSPDGSWMVVTEPPGTRAAYVLHRTTEPDIDPRTIWGGLAASDGSTAFGPVTWSPRSDWVARVVENGLELAAVDPVQAAVRVSRAHAVIDGLTWWQAVGTLGRIAAMSPDGTIHVFDIAPGTEASVVRAALRYDANVEPPPVLVWSPDGSRLALIGADGNLWIVEAESPAIDAHAVTADGRFRGSRLWGWSTDGARLGVGWMTVDPTTGMASPVPGGGDRGCASLPAWRPGGQDVAVVSNGRLELDRPDGTAVTVAGSVCQAPETVLRDPIEWSPDGRWLAVPVAREDADHWPLGLRLVAFDVETGSRSVVAEDERSGVNHQVRWRSQP